MLTHLMPLRGFMTREQRAYILLSLAVGGLGADRTRQARAVIAWRRFVRRYPQFASPLVPTCP